MRRIARFTAIGAVSLLSVGFGVFLSAPAGSAPITVPPQVAATNWSTDAVPTPSATQAATPFVSCATATFCMAVGQSGPFDSGTTLINQWNGVQWSPVASPAPSGVSYSELNAVSCVSPTFCMAVGQTGQNHTTDLLSEVWNGSSWTMAPSTDYPGSDEEAFSGVSCLSASWCVAVGDTESETFDDSLIEQWNGTSWTIDTVPQTTGNKFDGLNAVSCALPTSCMAVGATNLPSGDDALLAVQWNGAAWSLTSPIEPGPTDVDHDFGAVSCVGTVFCLAVGSSDDGTSSLAELWNGTEWSAVTIPAFSDPDALSGVDCTSVTSCTAVGYLGVSDPASQSLVLNWNGTGFTPATPPIGSGQASLTSVSCITNWRCEAAGYSFADSNYHDFLASAPIARSGYRFVASDGGVFNYGSGAPSLGSLGGTMLNKPIVGMSVMPAGDGYYLAASDGGVFAFGSARFYGSTGALTLNKPIVGMAVTADGAGYWLVASDGGIFAFGDAQFYGSTGALTLNKPIVGMAPTPNGLGYWLVASDGGIFAFGNATFEGSTGSITLNKPIVGMAPTSSGGYYLVASDGGIFTFPAINGPPFEGSTGALHLNKPIIGMTTVAGGYYLGGSDGGIFTFPAINGPPFDGSTGGITLNKPIVGLAS